MLRELPLAEPVFAPCAELKRLLAVATEARAAAKESALRDEHERAVRGWCDALVLVAESRAARLPLLAQLASTLARLERHQEAVAACDAGLRLLPWSKDSRHVRDQVRMLQRRAGCFLALRQPAQALADYRSAVALDPQSAQAAAGAQEAWSQLRSRHEQADLYRVLGVTSESSAVELRRAYHRLALRWHPDKHAQRDGAQQAEAEARFRQVQDAWAVLSDPELRSAYDGELGGAPG